MSDDTVIIFPIHMARVPRVLPVNHKSENNVIPLVNPYWFEAFMRRVKINLVPPQLMITQEKRLLLVDYSRT